MDAHDAKIETDLKNSAGVSTYYRASKLRLAVLEGAKSGKLTFGWTFHE